jgi:hypothetical protein
LGCFIFLVLLSIFVKNYKITNERRQNAEEKEAERQAANKLLLSLKSKQSSIYHEEFNAEKSASSSVIQGSSGLINMSMPNELMVAAAAAAAAAASASPSVTLNELDKNQNPLNKLIMMELSLKSNGEKQKLS